MDHSPQGTATLERVFAALAAGDDPITPLTELHEALLVAGDASGVDGRTRGRDPMGIGLGPPAEYVLLCPIHQCYRHAWPDSPEVPRCRISGQPMRRERL
jgi:hypothetical protein